MSSVARSAVILFDWGSLRITQVNAAARLLPGARSWIGRPLHEWLASIGPAATGPPLDRDRLLDHARSGSAFAIRIGDSVWRAEMSPLSASTAPPSGFTSANSAAVRGAPGASSGQPAVGALLLHEAGKAENYRDFALERVDVLPALAHDLRTPLNAMLGWIHLLSMPQRGPDLNVRALHGLRQAVEQQQRLLADWLAREGTDRPPAEASAVEPASRASAGSAGASQAMQGGLEAAPTPARRPKFAQAAAGGSSRPVSPDDLASFDAAATVDGVASIDRVAMVNGRARADTTAARHENGTGHDLSGVFVLAVDDRPELLEVLTQVLAADGASIETTTSADDALARYPDWASSGGERLLVSDLAMPGRDGFSLIREIRALERNRHMPRLPAVALSAHGLPDVRRRAIENGFDLFVDKPVDPRVLLGRLHRLLDR